MRADNSFEEKVNRCLHQDRLPFKTTSQEEARVAVMAQTANVYQLKSRFAFMKVAAAVLVLVLGSFSIYYLMGNTTIENMQDRTAMHSLPDGSTVVLKRGSAVNYNSSHWFFKRNIELKNGQAYFEVEKGKKFVVSTSFGNVTVLGTSFDVNINDNNIIVGCKSGAVQVDVQNFEPVVLTSGKELNFNLRSIVAAEVDPSAIAAWTDSMFVFNEVPISEVLETLEMETNYKFEYPENMALKYSGRVNLNLQMDEILEIVCVPLGLVYSTDPSKREIYIYKKEEL